MMGIHPTASVSLHARIHATSLVVGKHSRIDDGVIITGDVEIGDYVHLGAYMVLTGRAGIKIGNYSAISMYCAIPRRGEMSGRALRTPGWRASSSNTGMNTWAASKKPPP